MLFVGSGGLDLECSGMIGAASETSSAAVAYDLLLEVEGFGVATAVCRKTRGCSYAPPLAAAAAAAAPAAVLDKYFDAAVHGQAALPARPKSLVLAGGLESPIKQPAPPNQTPDEAAPPTATAVPHGSAALLPPMPARGQHRLSKTVFSLPFSASPCAFTAFPSVPRF